MLSTWLFIVFFSQWQAQVIEMSSELSCLQLKEFTDKEIDKNPNLKGKIATMCFKNMGKRTKES